MPPINQGSKTGLITATVILAVLFVVTLVLAFFANSDAAAKQAQIEELRGKYEGIIAENDLTGPVVNTATSGRDALKIPATTKLLSAAIIQRNQLSSRISPGGTDPAKALADADAAVAQIKTLVGANAPAPAATLTENISALVADVKARDAMIAALTGERDASKAQFTALQEETAAQIAAKDKEVAASAAAVVAATESVTAELGKKEVQVGEIQTTFTQASTAAEQATNALQAELTQAQQAIKLRDAQITALRGKLAGGRTKVDQNTKVGDGQIIKTPGQNIVYINLGSGDQIAAGMSFEVYDRLEGIPAIGDPGNDDNLPRGKASIEVVRVQAGSSECRIVRTTPGQTVVEGDLINNLVYDKNTRNNFVVYGNFDLDRNGVSTSTDTDVIKRLVTQWGGAVQDQLDTRTDFLVIGTPPVVPTFSEEDLANPINQSALDEARAADAAYSDLIARAVQLNIPILNQNRFLYFTGYYQQSAQ